LVGIGSRVKPSGTNRSHEGRRGTANGSTFLLGDRGREKSLSGAADERGGLQKRTTGCRPKKAFVEGGTGKEGTPMARYQKSYSLNP